MDNQELTDLVRDLFQKNRRHSGDFQFTVPSPNRYPYQWFWDSCFHAMILRHFDIESAKAELRSLVSKQFADGFIPHVIYWTKSEILDVDWGVEGSSSITQPPLLAEAVYAIYEIDADKSFLQEMLPSLEALYTHILERRHPQRGLIGIINPDESGEDTSPRFDEPQSLPGSHSPADSFEKRKQLFDRHIECNFNAAACTRDHFWVEDVAFNMHVLRNLESMSKIGEALDSHDLHQAYQEQAEALRANVKEHLFEDGFFYSFYGFEDRKKITTFSWSMFTPLASGLCSAEEARHMIESELLSSGKFWTTFPTPTVAVSEPSFDHHHWERSPGHSSPNWRGPVWMASNMYIFQALKRYGYEKEATHLRNQSLALILKSGFREYYDPFTGTGHGAVDFTWGGLVLEMK